MIPDEGTLRRFIKSRMNIFVYGPRATGKTTMIKKTFHDTNTEFIEINCTMGDKKVNFFKYLNHEMDKFFRRKIRQQKSKSLMQSYEKSQDPTSVHGWIQNVKNLDPGFRTYLNNIYFFIDSIQEIQLSANFITTFFSACQQKTIDDLNIPFVFCGINLPRKIYAVDKPFRNIISFCMRKPVGLMWKIIRQTTLNEFKARFRTIELKDNPSMEDIEKSSEDLAKQMYHSFEPMQTDLNRIKKMTRSLAFQIIDLLYKQMSDQESFLKKDKDKEKEKKKTLNQRLNSKINKGQVREYIREMLEQGPANELKIKRKMLFDQNNQEAEVELSYEFYPHLLTMSLNMADLHPECQDKRRFKDYKTQKGKANKNLQKRIAKHNLQRIIAISEALQDASGKQTPQQLLQHHSLFYYGCIEYLREEELICLQGKNSSFTSIKIFGETRPQEARTFMKIKMDLAYDDYVLR